MAGAAARTVLVHSVHPVPSGAKALRRTAPGKWIELTLGVKRLGDLPSHSALDERKPKDRTYLTRGQLAKSFGSDPKAVASIKSFAAAHGLIVTHEQPVSATLRLGGTARDISAAFGVTLFDYSHPELGEFHARTGPVSVPADLAGDITGVFGFNNHRILRRKSRSTVKSADTSTASRQWFIPTELAGPYDFPPAPPATTQQCIGLLEFGGGVDTADATAYFAKIGAAAPQITVVALDGVSTDPTTDPESTGEVMLDIDVAGALGGGAKLAVYFSTFDEKGLVDALAAVLNDSTNDPGVLSISWGWDENQPFNNSGIIWSASAIDHCNASFLAISQLGITVCVSTGDDGSEAQVKDGKAHVNFPASSPYVLAVGGTTLHVRKDSSGTQQITEVVWNDGPGGGGTGGGVSDLTPVPTWQAGKVPVSINPGNFAGRAIPDVAANADPATGYYTRSAGKFQVVGGTSASAPLVASLITRINATIGKRVGNFNALLYGGIGASGAFRDITSGNNDTEGLLSGQYPAKEGYDACTGWGAPLGAELLKQLSS